MDNTGGPAFPSMSPMYQQKLGGGIEIINAGMTLRDYFAGQALTGMQKFFVDTGDSHRDPNEPTHDQIAKEAYRFADAMLKEKQRREAGE